MNSDGIFQLLPEAKNHFGGFSGVQNVSVGLKEVGGKLVQELAFKIYVYEKYLAQCISVSQQLPKEFKGYCTDVVEVVPFVPTYGEDYQELLRPGMRIKGEGEGTLGCFARMKSDPSKIVILSNSHVLLGTFFIQGLDVGQPSVKCSWCCACRVIGETTGDIDNSFNIKTVEYQVDGGSWNTQDPASETDCAIAEFNFSRNYTNEVEEGVGMIQGTPPPGNFGIVGGSRVKKMSATSGFTEGTVLQFNNLNSRYQGGGALPDFLFPLNIGGNAVEDGMAGAVNNVNQILVMPEPDPNDANLRVSFAVGGDSGTVILNESNQVVGLMSRAWIIDQSQRDFFQNELQINIPSHVGTLGIVNPIHAVLENLDIEIVANMAGTAQTAAQQFQGLHSPPVKKYQQLTIVENLNGIKALLLQTPLGTHLYNALEEHHTEVGELVNRNREVTVVWHRNMGPAFTAILSKAARDVQYPIPEKVKSISLQNLVERMANVLSKHGSDSLRNAIANYLESISILLFDLKTVGELKARIQRLSHAKSKIIVEHEV